jgi:hypothetical protein
MKNIVTRDQYSVLLLVTNIMQACIVDIHMQISLPMTIPIHHSIANTTGSHFSRRKIHQTTISPTSMVPVYTKGCQNTINTIKRCMKDTVEKFRHVAKGLVKSSQVKSSQVKEIYS